MRIASTIPCHESSRNSRISTRRGSSSGGALRTRAQRLADGFGQGAVRTGSAEGHLCCQRRGHGAGARRGEGGPFGRRAHQAAVARREKAHDHGGRHCATGGHARARGPDAHASDFRPRLDSQTAERSPRCARRGVRGAPRCSGADHQLGLEKRQRRGAQGWTRSDAQQPRTDRRSARGAGQARHRSIRHGPFGRSRRGGQLCSAWTTWSR
jgi:hypothetical protein